VTESSYHLQERLLGPGSRHLTREDGLALIEAFHLDPAYVDLPSIDGAEAGVETLRGRYPH
jgi:hypothetical protein